VKYDAKYASNGDPMLEQLSHTSMFEGSILAPVSNLMVSETI
jgi:hypothetical protein